MQHEILTPNLTSLQKLTDRLVSVLLLLTDQMPLDVEKFDSDKLNGCF